MRIMFLAVLIFIASSALAQNQSGGMPGMDMSHASSQDQSQNKDMHDMPGMEGNGTAMAMHSMESHHMDMGPHMKMTPLRTPHSGDQAKADEVVTAARAAAEKYKNYKVALADGFRIFLPNVPQKQYHFTNYSYAFEARNNFDPLRPTSLLYEKHGDDYKLAGVMYTAKKDATEDQLNERAAKHCAMARACESLPASAR